MPVPTIQWKDDAVSIVDQTKLPTSKQFIAIRTEKQMWDAIKQLKVRGAPAIGIAAAFGIYLGIREFKEEDKNLFFERIDETCGYIASSRPTAVNLFWAVDRIKALVRDHENRPVEEIKELVLSEAKEMIEEDNRVCRRIGEHGVGLIEEGNSVLTHCNAGGLATAQYGTALAPIFRAQEIGRTLHVWVDETRPLLQGSRITAWELVEAGIPATLITDSMAAWVMSRGKVDLVIVGADRIARNGDTANKIGTLGVAVLAKEFNVPFYVAAPLSTIDRTIASGSEIPIEERDPEEIKHGFGKLTAPEGIDAYNPAFDVTPASYIRGIITEKGILKAPYEKSIAGAFDIE
ncbi:MAG TPA: S-methyl-5-thioribose-1-phosphate isomerase [Spirochaetota bacterium]|nr:S-methyl-5-thioribose-1-phosphate isomerase [Spirochaetota bacterium]